MQLSAKGADAELTKDGIVSALGYTPERDYGNYELIETITLTEDTAQIIRTQEPDGTAYNFKAAIVKLFVPASTTNGIVACNLSSNGTYSRNDAAITTVATYTMFGGRVCGNQLLYEPARTQNYPNNPMKVASFPFPPYNSANATTAKIDFINVYAVTSIIPTNSTITIYAIRM